MKRTYIKSSNMNIVQIARCRLQTPCSAQTKKSHTTNLAEQTMTVLFLVASPVL